MALTRVRRTFRRQRGIGVTEIQGRTVTKEEGGEVKCMGRGRQLDKVRGVLMSVVTGGGYGGNGEG